ncbi:gamma-glutamyltransferase [Microcystis aeruginosa NIES-298]|nr:gamma-glutamyltransferase [Microcystis aeruginosa NIES-298]TRU07080.1 MAG: gamma-glutamyltransferase [Microcystis sp. Msp_OC_L_20101000_S702]
MRNSRLIHLFAPLILPKTPEGNRLSGHKRSRFSGIVKFQSNFDGFAIGILVPQTGIALHNRASGFTLELGHPNPITPAKRPFHLIIPSFLRWDDGTFDGCADATPSPPINGGKHG